MKSRTGELADQRIDLAQAQRQLGVPLNVAAHEAVLTDADLKRSGAGILDGRGAVLLDQPQNALHAAYCRLAVFCRGIPRQSARSRIRLVGARQQRQRADRRPAGTILVLDAMASARLAQVFAQQLAGVGSQTYPMGVPPAPERAADPARAARRSKAASTSTQPSDAPCARRMGSSGTARWAAVAKPALFANMPRLPLGGAVNARGAPSASFPVIQ